MKKPDWKKLLKQAFSPKNEDARAQEKAAAWALGSILVLIFFPVMIIQFAVEGAKLAVMFPIM